MQFSGGKNFQVMRKFPIYLQGDPEWHPQVGQKPSKMRTCLSEHQSRRIWHTKVYTIYIQKEKTVNSPNQYQNIFCKINHIHYTPILPLILALFNVIFFCISTSHFYVYWQSKFRPENNWYWFNGFNATLFCSVYCFLRLQVLYSQDDETWETQKSFTIRVCRVNFDQLMLYWIIIW